MHIPLGGSFYEPSQKALKKADCSVCLGAQHPFEKLFYIEEIQERHGDEASHKAGIGKVDVTRVFSIKFPEVFYPPE